jgi:hypothetical protein
MHCMLLPTCFGHYLSGKLLFPRANTSGLVMRPKNQQPYLTNTIPNTRELYIPCGCQIKATHRYDVIGDNDLGCFDHRRPIGRLVQGGSQRHSAWQTGWLLRWKVEGGAEGSVLEKSNGPNEGLGVGCFDGMAEGKPKA